MQVILFSIQKQLQWVSSPKFPELSLRADHPAHHGLAASPANIVVRFSPHLKSLQGLLLCGQRSVGDTNKSSYYAIAFPPTDTGWRWYFGIFTVILNIKVVLAGNEGFCHKQKISRKTVLDSVFVRVKIELPPLWITVSPRIQWGRAEASHHFCSNLVVQLFWDHHQVPKAE